ncbi:hypothetical protein DM02DRAFT_202829 [Periconia macrospinosa]|uniref:C2H2-type domain-containing protein n=1 Tax=Periconia macrospinosa TaxID=97972 RepID=A0A2V1E0T2_9PLEO|nr:hypothetical protein DM02DRAFT_202829 [Periconia macrospinosa]
MNRKWVCNLLADFSHPPWTKSLDRVVYMSIGKGGEEQIPFHAYVQPNDTCTVKAHHNATFWSFSRFPEEIQLHILAMCPASTLFQLMHTSSKLRIEASKQFWANPNVYFYVLEKWLMDKAYQGDTLWDVSFLAQVQNVEVGYSLDIDERIYRQQNGRVEIESNLADIFWASLKDRIPNVKRVILNQHSGTRKMGDVLLAMQLLVEASPPGVECSILITEEKQTSESTPWNTDTFQRCLIQPKEQGVWEKRKPGKFRETVLPPPKKFEGPVGRFMELLYQFGWKIPPQRSGLLLLMVEALDRHHFDMGQHEPFSCPFSSCTAYFSNGGEWTIHAAEKHYHDWEKLPEYLPNSSAGTDLRERIQALDRKRREVREQFQKIRDAWRTSHEARRREMKYSMIEQLANDPSWETEEKGEKHWVWEEFLRAVSIVKVGIWSSVML